MVGEKDGRFGLLGKLFRSTNPGENSPNIGLFEAGVLDKALRDILEEHILDGDIPVALSENSETGELVIRHIFEPEELEKIRSDLQKDRLRNARVWRK